MKTIKEILNQSFPYLDSFKNKFLLIGAIGLYSAFFLSVYIPFNIDQWGSNPYWKYVLLGIVVISISQFVLRPIFGLKTFKYYSLILWGLFEMLLMASALHFVYALPLDALNDSIYDYLDTIKIVCLVAIVPYGIIVTYLAIKEKFSSFKKLEQNSLLPSDTSNELLTISGENNKVVLAINYNQLLYIKSSGNYLDIYYLKGEKASKELVRLSLKELETKILDSSIVRIHRSYMVNKHKISSFKKTRKGYKLIVQHAPGEILPVSIGYKDKFEEALEV